MKIRLLSALLITATAVVASADEILLWDESIHGSLDAYREYPTNGYLIQFVGEAVAETNIIRGSSRTLKIGENALGEDNAFFFVVPVGRRIAALTIETQYDPVWMGPFSHRDAYGLLCANSTGLWENRDSVYGPEGYWFCRDKETFDLLTPYGIGPLSAGPYAMQVGGSGSIHYLMDGQSGYMYYTLRIKTEPNLIGISIKLLANNNLLLSWPTSAIGFTLQSTTSLNSPATWTDVTNSLAVLGANFVVTNSISSERTFFRLRKP